MIAHVLALAAYAAALCFALRHPRVTSVAVMGAFGYWAWQAATCGQWLGFGLALVEGVIFGALFICVDVMNRREQRADSA